MSDRSEGITRAYGLLRAGQRAAAVDAIRGERMRDPASTYLMAVEADVLWRAGRADAAEALLRTHPDRDAPYVARRLVTVNFRLKQYREALALAQKVLQAPDLGDPAWFKGMPARCLERLGDTGQAIEFWQESKAPEARMKVIRLKLRGLEPALALRESQQRPATPTAGTPPGRCSALDGLLQD